VVLEALVEAKQGADAKVRLSWHPSSQDAAAPHELQLRLCEVLEEVGRVPLPPYMKREADAKDLECYQTPHALREGSVAAPTAGACIKNLEM
jgi:S-adenosylmethionine:tRNA ribosyltransferase-isomerase